MSKAQGDSRRTFLTWLIGLGGAGIGALVALPGMGYLADPLRRAVGTRGRWATVGDLETMPKDHPVSLPVIGEQVDAWTRATDVSLGMVWVRRGEGEQVQAWNAECPHLGCKVGYDRDKARFGCPCHDSEFSPEGKRLGGPAPRSLDSLDTRVKDGKVEVRFVRFRAQTSERVEIG